MESISSGQHFSRCVVKNICVSDGATGIIVFQKVYKWKESTAFYNLGNLIQALYQFSMTTDDGNINCVNFESGRMLTTRLHNNHDSAQARNQMMQMITTRTDEIIVSLFFDTQGLDMPPWEDRDKLQVLLHAILAAFEENYLSELVIRRPGLAQELEDQSLISGDSDTHTVTAFSEFGQIVDFLRHELFPNQDLDLSSGQLTMEEPVLDSNLTLDEHVMKLMNSLKKSGLLENQRRKRMMKNAAAAAASIGSGSYANSSVANDPPSPPPRPTPTTHRQTKLPVSCGSDIKRDKRPSHARPSNEQVDDARAQKSDVHEDVTVTDSTTSTKGNNRMTGGMFGMYFGNNSDGGKEDGGHHDGSNRSNTISELSENTFEIADWRSKHDSSRIAEGISSLKDV